MYFTVVATSSASCLKSSVKLSILPRRIASPKVTMPSEEKGASESFLNVPSVVLGTPIASKMA